MKGICLAGVCALLLTAGCTHHTGSGASSLGENGRVIQGTEEMTRALLAGSSQMVDALNHIKAGDNLDVLADATKCGPNASAWQKVTLQGLKTDTGDASPYVRAFVIENVDRYLAVQSGPTAVKFLVDANRPQLTDSKGQVRSDLLAWVVSGEYLIHIHTDMYIAFAAMGPAMISAFAGAIAHESTHLIDAVGFPAKIGDKDTVTPTVNGIASPFDYGDGGQALADAVNATIGCYESALTAPATPTPIATATPQPTPTPPPTPTPIVYQYVWYGGPYADGDGVNYARAAGCPDGWTMVDHVCFWWHDPNTGIPWCAVQSELPWGNNGWECDCGGTLPMPPGFIMVRVKCRYP